MQVVLLCGGKGTRLGKLGRLTPKPLVEVGGIPIVEHIIQSYKSRVAVGTKLDFILAVGYKKDIFVEKFKDRSDVTVVDTGVNTLTAERLLALKEHIYSDTFLVTYGDGVSDVDIESVIDRHFAFKKIATLVAAYPPIKFGVLRIKGGHVLEFKEKPKYGEQPVNAGYFVFDKKIFDYLRKGETLETALQRIAQDGELVAYEHFGFWQCMDTLQEKELLEKLWAEDKAKWAKRV